MQDAYIYDGLRTPFGRHGGSLAAIRPDELLGLTLKALVARNPFALESYEEMLDDYYTEPTKEDSTELGEVPQATEKGSIRPGYTYDPYWMSYMLENLQKED